MCLVNLVDQDYRVGGGNIVAVTFQNFVDVESERWQTDGLFGNEAARLDSLALPEIIEIEPIHFCNFNCIMCHVHFEGAMSRRKLDLDIVLKRLKSAGLEEKWLLIASGYEGTAHPDFAHFANGVSDIGMKLELTTNGSLLTKKLVSEIKDANFKYVTLSFDGSTKETFEYIREGSNFERTVGNIENFRESLRPHGTYFNVNHTTMQRNLDEIPDTVRFWDDRDIDQIFFIGMRVRPVDGKHQAEGIADDVDRVIERLEEAADLVINERRRITLASPFFLQSTINETHPGALHHHVVKSKHPDVRIALNPRSYYQNGSYPGMAVECRSPFKFARIDYNGDVFLCQKFNIGNILEQEFTDIWYGEKADKVRELVLAGGSVCQACDHYRLCVKADELDVRSPEALRQTVPRHIGEFMSYSILKLGDQFYGVPLSTIHEDLSPVAGATFVADDVDSVMSQITEQTFAGKKAG